MLDPWIIEEILKKEREQRDGQGDRAHIPAPPPHRHEHPTVTPPKSDEGERGVVVIDI